MNRWSSSLITLSLSALMFTSYFFFGQDIAISYDVSLDEEIVYPKMNYSSLLTLSSFQEAFENWPGSLNFGQHNDASKILHPRNRKLIERKDQSETSGEKRKIKHKSLIPLSTADIIGYLCASIGTMLAAVGGVGGGGILIPIYILIMNFSPKYAIPLSSVSIFGGALANLLFNVFKRHPLADRPLIDWDLILLMEPLTLLGALIGTLINRLLPETFLIVMLVILLGFTGVKTLRKAYTISTERDLLIASRGDFNDENLEMTDISEKEGDGFEDEHLHVSERSGAAKALSTSKLLYILEKEKRQPKRNIFWLIVMSSVILLINVLKGGGDFESPLHIKCGSVLFWVANIFMFLWLMLFSIGAKFYLLRKHEVKLKVGYKYLVSDIQWNQRATIIYPAVCCLAGFFAGMFGIGGGIIKGPLMLAIGVHPRVAAATSACMILFTSSSNIISYAIFGLLTYDYAVTNLLTGFFFSMVAQTILFYGGTKFSIDSFIAYSIGYVVILSAMLMTAQSIFAIVEDEARDNSLDKLCGTSY